MTKGRVCDQGRVGGGVFNDLFYAEAEGAVFIIESVDEFSQHNARKLLKVPRLFHMADHAIIAAEVVIDLSLIHI